MQLPNTSLKSQILQKIGMTESLFPFMKDWMVNVLLPAHLKLVGKCETNIENPANEALYKAMRDDISQTRNLVIGIVKKAISNPKVCCLMDKNGVFW
jgi:hypothetical protein